MKLYFMNPRSPIVPRDRVAMGNGKCCGGYVPLLLGVHHGAGVMAATNKVDAVSKVRGGADLARAKSILTKLNPSGPQRKKYISI